MDATSRVLLRPSIAHGARTLYKRRLYEALATSRDLSRAFFHIITLPSRVVYCTLVCSSSYTLCGSILQPLPPAFARVVYCLYFVKLLFLLSAQRLCFDRASRIHTMRMGWTEVQAGVQLWQPEVEATEDSMSSLSLQEGSVQGKFEAS